MDFDSSRPIYLQLLEDFKIKISTGAWPPGSKIDSVRSLAASYQVNPNTVQRALADLEREGLCESKRTAGRFVTEEVNKIDHLSDKAFYKFADDFIVGMNDLDIKKSAAIHRLESYWEEKND